MEKRKLLTAVLFCFSLAGMALAAEVINIDLNNYGDANAYTGEAAVAGATVWRAYYGGWGKPMGSAKTAGLADYDEPNKPGTYAAQVWIGDNGNNHDYIAGSDLMGDGFEPNVVATEDPCISLIGLAQDPCWGGGAYQGVFDIYVYGTTTDSNFWLRTSVVDQNLGISGGFDGNFVEGKNYVVFSNVSIDDGNQANLSYNGSLNGLQLVKKVPVTPVAIENGTVISAGNYDVAHETNARASDAELSLFGPDIGTGTFDLAPVNRGGCVSHLDASEYMKYDITVDDVNQGYYRIRPEVATWWGPANMDMYLDDELLGTVTHPQSEGDGTFYEADTWVETIIFEGGHEVKWVTPGDTYFDIGSLRFTRISDVNMLDCDAVYKYGFNYPSDYDGDCRVDVNDLKIIVDHWVECFDPNQDNCP